MLIKASEVIGLKVYTMRAGRHIDDIQDVIYDPSENKILALLVDAGGWFKDAKLILFEDIKSIGKDAVIVESSDVLKKASDIKSRASNIAKENKYLTKTKIITEGGMDLGNVSDIYFDDKTGKVIDLEVSQGAIKNMQSGKKRVKVEDIMTVGQDATIVRGYTEDKLEEQGEQQGIKGVMNQMQDKIEETKNDPRTQHKVEEVKAKLQKAQDDAETLLSQGKHVAREKSQEIKENYPTAGSLGGKSEHSMEHTLPAGTNIEIPGETQFTTIKETKIKPVKK